MSGFSGNFLDKSECFGKDTVAIAKFGKEIGS